MSGSFCSCVGRVIREKHLMAREDAVESLLLARQQFGFLEEDNVILLCKFGQCVVDAVLVVGVM